MDRKIHCVLYSYVLLDMETAGALSIDNVVWFHNRNFFYQNLVSDYGIGSEKRLFVVYN